MSFDSRWRIPGPWNEAQLRSAIAHAAALLGASVSVMRGADGLRVGARFDHDTVLRYRVGDEGDPSLLDGTIDLSPPGDTTLELGFLPTVCVGSAWVGDEDRAPPASPSHVQVLAVDRAALARRGLEAIRCASADGEVFHASRRGLWREHCVEPRRPIFGAALRSGEPAAYFVGADGLVVRSTSGSDHVWTSVSSPTGRDLLEATFDARGRLYVSGPEGVWRLDGERWVTISREGGALTSDPSGRVWLGGRVLDAEPAREEAPAGRAVFAAGRSEPWILEHEAVWTREPSGWRRHDTGSPESITCGTVDANGDLWVGADADWIARFDGDRFEPFHTGGLGRVQAIVTVGDRLVAAVDCAEATGGPALAMLAPRSAVTLSVPSNRGANRATWGATTELATRIAESLGGILDDA